MKPTALSTFLLGLLPFGGLHATSPLDSLLRAAQYDEVSISPNGEYLAASFMLEDRSVLVIVDRSTMKITGRVDPGKDGFVEAAYWASGDRIFVTASKRFGLNEQPWLLPTVYAVDAHGKNRASTSADIIDTLEGDDEHILINRCVTRVAYGCTTEVRRMRMNLKGNGEVIAKGPYPNSQFLADNAGRVRFAWSWDKDDRQRLSLMAGEDGRDDWRLINDEQESGVEVVPLGTSRDDRHAFLRTEMADGPDAIESLDLRTGERKVVLRHEFADPGRVLWSADGSEPIGVVFATPLPTLGFWNEQHPDAVFMREIEKAFPGEYAIPTSFTRDGERAIVTASSDRDPGRFYLVERTSGKVALLNKRRPWLDPSRLAATKPFQFRARDGLMLHGFITSPPGAGERRSPTIVMPHGGPYDEQDHWLFDEDSQVLAMHGYAVVRVNFRGSGGRGRRFVEAGFREWGDRMQDDVTDTTRWAITEGIADPSKVCIFGASYGGYAALMGAIREPELYRCAIAVAAPADLNMMWEWGDIQNSRYGAKFLERVLGRDRGDLARRSPARRVREIKAKLMLVYGGRDARVPLEHMRAMRTALDESGKTYTGYFPSFEAHGIFNRDNRIEYYTRILGFLESSLSAAPEIPAVATPPVD